MPKFDSAASTSSGCTECRPDSSRFSGEPPLLRAHSFDHPLEQRFEGVHSVNGPGAIIVTTLDPGEKAKKGPRGSRNCSQVLRASPLPSRSYSCTCGGPALRRSWWRSAIASAVGLYVANSVCTGVLRNSCTPAGSQASRNDACANYCDAGRPSARLRPILGQLDQQRPWTESIRCGFLLSKFRPNSARVGPNPTNIGQASPESTELRRKLAGHDRLWVDVRRFGPGIDQSAQTRPELPRNCPKSSPGFGRCVTLCSELSIRSRHYARSPRKGWTRHGDYLFEAWPAPCATWT